MSAIRLVLSALVLIILRLREIPTISWLSTLIDRFHSEEIHFRANNTADMFQQRRHRYEKSKWKLHRKIFIMLATMLLTKRWFSMVYCSYVNVIRTMSTTYVLTNVRKVTQRKRFIWKFVSHFIFRITTADIIKRLSIKELCKNQLVFVNSKHWMIWYLIPCTSLRRQLFHFCSPLCFLFHSDVLY